jgi:hypothetical protein
MGRTLYAMAAYAVCACASAAAKPEATVAPQVATAPTATAPAPPESATRAPANDWAGGYGDYRFGMTRAEVKSVKSCQPYNGFFSNPDFECPNLDVDGKTRNVSFHFDPAGRLTKVQLWYAESAELAQGVQALLDVNEHFRIHFGSSAPPNAAELVANLLHGLRPYPARIVVRPSGNLPKDAEIWCEVAWLPQAGYYVMLYYAYPPTTPAAVKATDPK